ncbi:MAG TPA: hypothetical protein VEP67_02120 [Thiobacillaceae bacterium]|nr:hypothetical protein [Thiobacillaceae bacterium]
MKRLFIFLLLVLAVVLGSAWLVLEDKPSVEPVSRITRDDMVWAKELFQRHDPRKGAPNTVQTLTLSEEEVNRLLNYAVVLKPLSAMSVDLSPKSAQIQATLRFRPNPFGRYMNILADIEEEDGKLRLISLRVGDVPFPSWLARGAARLAQTLLKRDDVYASLADAVTHISLSENQLVLDYRWQPELLTRLERRSVSLLVSEADRERLLSYADFIAKQIRRRKARSSLDLPKLMSPVFERVRQRGGDAAAENRAALISLSAYVSGISMKKLLTDSGHTTRRAPDVALTLYNRTDWPQHYLIAAALSVSAGSRLANIIGLAKEEDDTKSGSGFSFTDLAVDRAGARLGELSQGEAAARIQTQLAAADTDAALCPPIADLPEFMGEEEFARRFGKVGSPAYRKVIAEIDRRLARHPLLGRDK